MILIRFNRDILISVTAPKGIIITAEKSSLSLFQFASLDRKIIELYDDLMSQVSHTSASKGKQVKPVFIAGSFSTSLFSEFKRLIF